MLLQLERGYEHVDYASLPHHLVVRHLLYCLTQIFDTERIFQLPRGDAAQQRDEVVFEFDALAFDLIKTCFWEGTP